MGSLIGPGPLSGKDVYTLEADVDQMVVFGWLLF